MNMPTYRYGPQGEDVPKNTPILSLTAFALMLIVGGAIAITGSAGKHGGEIILAVIVGNIPGALSAVFAERASRDIRNGTVKHKVKEAIKEAQVVTRDGPLAAQSVAAAKTLATSAAALQELLERNTRVTVANTEAHREEHHG